MCSLKLLYRVFIMQPNQSCIDNNFFVFENQIITDQSIFTKLKVCFKYSIVIRSFFSINLDMLIILNFDNNFGLH